MLARTMENCRDTSRGISQAELRRGERKQKPRETVAAIFHHSWHRHSATSAGPAETPSCEPLLCPPRNPEFPGGHRLCVFAAADRGAVFHPVTPSRPL